ncbi:hypothetical protein [Chitinophaga alhagiae]|uniref:hypothetical protein n=1 Tax=Chitinophaga alhagiae TaxID=2203219 RepID=UPI000E5BE284|nr:hypothetical protein [Chitinophaga alhagiae]
MRLIWLIIWMLPAMAAAAVPGEQIRTFEIKDSSGSTYTLKLALDNSGRPQYFFRNIFTPVCNTGECKPVYINFYWDLLGNYTRFDMPAGEVLTKTDHREFREEDYRKLQEIISRETSIFSELKMEDLVVKGTEKISDSADVKTGATLKTIKNEVIEGAVYTCYTLWHLAHGSAVEEMRKIMETYTSTALLHRFMQSGNHHYQYWAMEKVMDAEGHVRKGFGDDVAGIISGSNIFTARFALQKAAPAYFTPARQLWLWEAYAAAPYPLQMAILKKMTGLRLGEPVMLKIADAVTAGNRQQFTAKMALLASAGPKVQRRLAAQLDEAEPSLAADMYAALQQMNITDKTVRQKMMQYEKKTKQTQN